jgi:hypothetical protein
MQFEDMPHLKILEQIDKTLTEALNFILHHPLESIEILESPEEEEEAKQTKLIQNVIEEEKKDKKDSNSRNMIIKVSKTPVHKLNNVMFKKMLIKYIIFFFDERVKTAEKNFPFGEFVFNCLMKKYMMKRAAESRFQHLLSSCMKYKSIPKVRVFSRLIGLYDEFDEEDLEFYIDCSSFLKNSPSGSSISNSETSESYWIPYVRCLECLKHITKSIPPEKISDLKEYLEKSKKNDKQNPKGIIELDEFLEKILEAFSWHKKTTRSFINLIYEAADLNEDGYLQQREFELIIRYLSEHKFSNRKCKELFEQYAENFMAEDDRQVKAISFINLCQMDQQNNIFSLELIYNFTGVADKRQAEEKLSETQLEETIEEIRWRYSENMVWEEHQNELNDLLKIVLNKASNQTNPEEVWLALRLLEEDSKRCVIEENVKELLPGIGVSFFEYEELVF